MIICIIFYQIIKIIVKQKIPKIIERIDLDRKPGFSLTKLNVAEMGPRKRPLFPAPLSVDMQVSPRMIAANISSEPKEKTRGPTTG